MALGPQVSSVTTVWTSCHCPHSVELQCPHSVELQLPQGKSFLLFAALHWVKPACKLGRRSWSGKDRHSLPDIGNSHPQKSFQIQTTTCTTVSFSIHTSAMEIGYVVAVQAILPALGHINILRFSLIGRQQCGSCSSLFHRPEQQYSKMHIKNFTQ